MSELNKWFLSLPKGRQKILRADKWMLAENAFKAGNGYTKDPAMNKWIEEMGKTAGKYSSEFALISDDPRVTLMTGKNEIYLEGVFSIQQLTALITHMKKYTKEEE